MIVASPMAIHGHQAELLGCSVTRLCLVGGMFTLSVRENEISESSEVPSKM
jgi:carbonic anhydrase/acetyltransferase-like protein (isoleucine patch superfamily)